MIKTKLLLQDCIPCFYSVFHLFKQAKFAYGGSILSLSLLLLLLQLPQKNEAFSKVIKISLKIIISCALILIHEIHCSSACNVSTKHLIIQNVNENRISRVVLVQTLGGSSSATLFSDLLCHQMYMSYNCALW